MSDKMDKKIIGIYGGSFDPVHKGHVSVASAFVQQINPYKLMVIPCCIPPHKEKQGGANGYLRYTMLNAVFDGMEQIEVSDIELKRDNISYTIDTVYQIKKDEPDAELMLVVGTDMFLSLHEWRKAEELLTICDICLYNRGNTSSDKIDEYTDFLKNTYGTKVVRLKGEIVDISSTELRGKLLSNDDITDCIPVKAYDIIKQTGIYMSGEDRLSVYRNISKNAVDEVRFAHILRVEDAAEKMANIFGVDVFKARAAAILHDVTKRKTFEEQMAFAEEFGIEQADEFEQSPKVAHAFTAGGYIKKYLSINDEDIVNAVTFHTTGRPGMSSLEKLIFLADGVEDGRTFDGVDVVRKYVFDDLDMDMAMLESLEQTKRKVESKGMYMNSLTAEAIEYFEDLIQRRTL